MHNLHNSSVNRTLDKGRAESTILDELLVKKIVRVEQDFLDANVDELGETSQALILQIANETNGGFSTILQRANHFVMH